MKKTKQKGERYKNTNKICDVTIMEKIIIQIYSILQVLWSNKVKFVSLSQLLDAPSLGPTLVFSQFHVLLSHLWWLEKKDGGKKRYKGEKEGVEQERRKERKKVLTETKNNRKIIIKNYLKKKKTEKNKPAGFKLAKSVLLVVLGCSQLRKPRPALLQPNQHSDSLQPSGSPVTTGSGTQSPLG